MSIAIECGLDFGRPYRFALTGSFFSIRANSNLKPRQARPARGGAAHVTFRII
jgi:hypothetical protein